MLLYWTMLSWSKLTILELTFEVEADLFTQQIGKLQLTVVAFLFLLHLFHLEHISSYQNISLLLSNVESFELVFEI